MPMVASPAVPPPMSLQVADIAGGSYHAVMGILAAVVHRQETGEGQYIDISLTDAVFSMQVSSAPGALHGGIEPEPEEMIFNGGTFYDCYETRDGRHLSIAGIEPHFFKTFCEALGHPEWADHALSPDKTVQQMLRREISRIIRTRDIADWEDLFRELDCCVEPVLKYSEACQHPQIKNRELLVEVGVDPMKQVQPACPIKFSKTDPEYRFLGVDTGAHNRAILEKLGFSDHDIKELSQSHD